MKQRSILFGSLTTSLQIAIAVTMLMTAACTKKKDLQDKVGPDVYVSKADLNGKVFSLSRGIEDADSNNTVGLVPGFSHNYGQVKARVTKDELQFIPVFDPTGRQEVEKILVSFPIKEHFDIQRDKNDFGEDTNKIVKNSDRPWDQRAYMTVDWAHPNNSIGKLSTYSAEDFSVKEENTVLAEEPKNENGHISFLTETSMGWNLGTDGDHNGELLGSYRAKIRTHLMPLKQSDFQPVSYSKKDFGRFGLFLTQQNFEDPEKGWLDTSIKRYANVFNVCEPGHKGDNGQIASCSTNQIHWALTKNFPAEYLDAAKRAVSKWNEAFQLALGRKDTVVDLLTDKAYDISDPRANLIAYYEPKAGGGLLGVAQWVENQQTGELISARATIYGDGIRYEQGMIDDLVDLILQDPSAKDEILSSITTTNPATSSLDAQAFVTEANVQQAVLGLGDVKPDAGTASAGLVAAAKASVAKGGDPAANEARKLSFMQKYPQYFKVSALTQAGLSLTDGTVHAPNAKLNLFGGVDLNGVENLLLSDDSLQRSTLHDLRQAELGIHSAEFVDEAVVRYIAKMIKAQSNTTTLDQMRAQLKADAAQLIFYTTLLHEMGHTFGLRHNFQASADSKNYMPEYYQLKQRIDKGDTSVSPLDLDPYAYSSVMDYGADFFAAGAGLGSYDKAAIKYAYNKSIDKEADPIVQANFAFCTDHQAAYRESILCQQFDKGKNVSEITANLINTNQRNYIRSHFRRNRAGFNEIARSIPRSLLYGTMFRTRQVLDELLYTLITDQAAPVVAAGECDLKFLRLSTVPDKTDGSVEMANICDPVAAEKAGVDSADLFGTIANALVESNNHFYKSPSDYKAYSLADLVYAGEMVKKFYQQTLGAPEPGTFLAEQDPKSGMISLTRLSDAGANDAEKLKSLALDRNIEDPNKFANDAKDFVTELKQGRFAKVMNSKISESGTERQLDVFGYNMDKYVALIALGTRNIGVRKYRSPDVSMSGNAYSWPHSKAFTMKLFDRFVTGNPAVSAFPVTLRNGKTALAQAEAGMSTDLQALSSEVGLLDLSSDQDPSVLERMRVCNEDQHGCVPTAGAKAVEYRSTVDQVSYRAAQSETNDSISYDLVSEAAALAAVRDKQDDYIKNKKTLVDAALKSFVDSESKRDAFEKTLLSVPELSGLAKTITDVSSGSASAWIRLQKELQTQDESQKFQSQARLVAIAQDIDTASNAIVKLVQTIGDSGKCKTDDKGVVDTECAKTTAAQKRQVVLAAQAGMKDVSDTLQNGLTTQIHILFASANKQRAISKLNSKDANVRFLWKLMDATQRL